MINDKKGTLAKLYSKLQLERKPYEERARDAASVTIPSVLKEDGENENTTFNTPYQSMGARGVNNLSAKLLLSLLPPNTPFFKLQLNKMELDKLGAEDPDLATELESALADVEKSVMSEIETSKVRISVFEALRHLIITGNALLYIPKKGDIRVFHLDAYTIKRDSSGNILSIVTKEKKAFGSLGKSIQEEILQSQEMGTDVPEDKEFDLYTGIVWNSKVNKWDVHQEVSGLVLPESIGTYPKKDNPYIALRFSKVDGESYGRGFVEEYLGDLVSLEGLRESLLKGAKMAAKTVWMVRPGSATDTRSLTKAKTGDIVKGNPEDIAVIQMNKFPDFQVAQQAAQGLEQVLSRIFLLNDAVQRQAERVTAEEIRFMIQELETTLGGVYSILSQEFQLPLVRALMSRMAKDKRLPKLPEGIVQPVIVTGVEALGRGNDLNKLNIFIEQAMRVLGPEIVGSMLNIDNLLTRIATSIGIDVEGLIKTEEERAAEAQAQQEQALIQQAAPGAIQEGIKQLGNQQQQPEG